MSDLRIRNLAKVLVRYSIRARKGDTVGVSAAPVAEPLVAAVYEELLRAGAFPVVRLVPDSFSEIFYRSAKPHHFRTVPKWQTAYAKCIDATIDIYSQTNTRRLSHVDPKKQAVLARAMKPVRQALRRKRWVLTLYPTEAYARDAGMSLREFEDFLYGAMFVDRADPVAAWLEVRRRQDRLIRALRGAHRVRITGHATDLSFSIRNRRFVNSDGRTNMPSGEIYCAPVEDSAEGTIAFDYPSAVSGRDVSGIRLVFRKGRVVEATAERGQDYLDAMLGTDPGARRLGEFGIGTNRNLRRFTGKILLDEKMGGTIHLALGASLHGSGGRNESGIHWDLIRDLRRGGALHVDGRLFQKDGQFLDS